MSLRMQRVQRLAAAILASAMWNSSVDAMELGTGSDAKVHWDNTIKYSAAWRVNDQSSKFIDNSNTDDGDRNFDRGLISNRLDILSELDFTYKEIGARISGAAWYDTEYNHSNDNDSPATANSYSVEHNEFPAATRTLHGRKAEILDGFVFGKGQVGNTPASFRAGKHTLLWGESLLLATNGISYAQAPLDIIKALSVPNTPAKELFLPVGQISGQLIPVADLTLAAYYQYQWKKTRLPAAGSYFSSADILDEGGERLFVAAPVAAFYRGQDMQAKDSGQWGASLRYRARAIDTEFGLYYIRFNDKLPQVYLQPGAGADPAIGKIGEYALVYPENIRVIGASFSTNVGSASIAGELHARRNTPLASSPQVVLPGMAADNEQNALYAVGNTVHAQISVIHILPRTPLWPTASITGEIGGQRLTSITKNSSAFLTTQERNAWGFRAILTPTYFQVLPNLDINVPIALGYNPKGKAPIAGFNGGAHRGGDVSIGITAEYRKAWNSSLRFTHYFGSDDFQTLRDRDFIAFSIQRTF